MSFNTLPPLDRLRSGRRLCLLTLALTVASALGLSAQPDFANLFGPHAVLQSGKSVPIWGTAEPGEPIDVTYGSDTVTAVADANGHWKATLPAQPVGKNSTLVASSPQGETRSEDVIVGDVWLLSGQSNIEWTVVKSDHYEQETANADYPRIRQFKVRPYTSETVQSDAPGEWVVCTPNTVGGFSAIGFFMARELFNLTGTPQGLINSTKGGTRIEPWMSDEAIASNPALAVITERWDAAAAAYPEAKKQYDVALSEWKAAAAQAKADGVEFKTKQPSAPWGSPLSRGRPANKYRAMIAPVLPYAMKGMIWYQGEANWKHPREYEAKLKALIEDWRARHGDPNLPFIVMQMPIYGGNSTTGWSLIREAQFHASRDLDNVSLVVTVDLGDPKDIHPRNKQDFGHRVALVVRRNLLGEDVIAYGPQIVGSQIEGDRVHLQIGGEGKPILEDNPDAVGAFEIAGEDRHFYPAIARIEGQDIVVTSEQVPHPAAVRYAWRSAPKAILFNQEGLPAAPYRSDNWVDDKP